jgi:hypothetical protein
MRLTNATRHSPLFTLESGQSGLGIYTSLRDAALFAFMALIGLVSIQVALALFASVPGH